MHLLATFSASCMTCATQVCGLPVTSPVARGSILSATAVWAASIVDVTTSALWLRAQRRQSPHAQGSVACTLRGRAPGELPRLAVCICTIGRDKGAPKLRLQPRGVERPGTLTAWLLVFGFMCQRIDMAVLAKNKFQENLQFLHWLHNQWVAAGSKVDDYDPVRRRSSCKGEEDTCPVHAA